MFGGTSTASLADRPFVLLYDSCGFIQEQSIHDKEEKEGGV